MRRHPPAAVTEPDAPRLGVQHSPLRLGGAACSSTAPLAGSSSAPAPAGSEAVTAEQFEDWVEKVWLRMDRDHSGEITREELNCDEFQIILKSVIAPTNEAERGGASYARTEVHIEQALNFCLRKADINNNGSLSKGEFKAFMRMLRNQTHGDRVNLIFALFDVDSSGRLDRDEFKGICRYYLGHEPTTNMVNEEWLNLDADEKGYATLTDYSKWLKTSASPVFRQLAQAVEGDPKARKVRRQINLDTAAGIVEVKRHRDRRLEERPLWNQGFNTLDTCIINEAVPAPLRTYLSRPQSLPELRRYLDRHGHSSKYDDVRKFMAEKKPEEPKRILSNDTARLPCFLPQRYQPGGRMRNKCGKKVKWMNEWQTPKGISHGDLGPRLVPGTLTLRCPPKCPDWLFFGKDYEEDDVEEALVT